MHLTSQNTLFHFESFPKSLSEIEDRIKLIDPEKYARSRNFRDGAVTYLSPYISRGVISTRMVYEHIKSLGLPWNKCEKLIQELAWRDYWQLVWIEKGEGIHKDLKHEQYPVLNHEVPSAIIHAETGIQAIDQAIRDFYETGYMHNHMRMYVAALCCNMAYSHWKEPAKWMYAHLLDGDLASNNLSWQWVAGAFSNKKYLMNQQNINKYFQSSQKNSFLDVDYDEFNGFKTPAVLERTAPFRMKTPLPPSQNPVLQNDKTLVYTYYNLDPFWHKTEDMQRVLLLEPSVFERFPVGKKCIDFSLDLAQNIEGIQVFIGEFSELKKHVSTENIVYKEHPLSRHFEGRAEERTWISAVMGYYPSFFGFWKKCKKEIAF